MNRLADIVDTSDSFGWISIALHWATATVVLSMWFIGQSIDAQSSPESIDALRKLHITIGLVSWVLLAGRIAWRVRQGHPRVDGQTLMTHRIARSMHYLMLMMLGIMILTGPVIAWLGPQASSLSLSLHAVHRISANVFFILIAIHVLAALKHLMFHDDSTVVRMVMPKQ